MLREIDACTTSKRERESEEAKKKRRDERASYKRAYKAKVGERMRAQRDVYA